jgi:hypothetical protein
MTRIFPYLKCAIIRRQLAALGGRTWRVLVRTRLTEALDAHHGMAPATVERIGGFGETAELKLT